MNLLKSKKPPMPPFPACFLPMNWAQKGWSASSASATSVTLPPKRLAMMSAIALKSGSWGDATMNSACGLSTLGPTLAWAAMVATVAPESSVMVAVPSAETPTGVGDLDGTVNFLVVGGRAPFLIGHGGSLMVTVFLTTGMVTVQEELRSRAGAGQEARGGGNTKGLLTW